MNRLFANFWFWFLSIVFLLMVVIGLIIYQSYQPKNYPQPNGSEANEVTVSPEPNLKPVDSKSEVTVDPSFPAPAKKLHQLIDESPSIDLDDKELSQRVDKLNKQLETLNQQLREKGVDVPDLGSPNGAGLDEDQNVVETQERLEAIQSFMSEKES